MSQWAEIRHMHLVDGVAKKEIARRFGLDVKTVRRAGGRQTPPTRRRTPKRGRRLDGSRDVIVGLLRDEPRITAKRIRRLLAERARGLDPEALAAAECAIDLDAESAARAACGAAFAPSDLRCRSCGLRFG